MTDDLGDRGNAPASPPVRARIKADPPRMNLHVDRAKSAPLTLDRRYLLRILPQPVRLSF